MDALGLDVYHADYQEKVQEIETERRHPSSHSEDPKDSNDNRSSSPEAPGGSPLPDPTPNPLDSIKDNTYYVSSELASGETVPVGGREDSERSSDVPTKSSTSSSSSTDSSSRSNFGTTSLYQVDFLAPKMNYDRENDGQKLVAVIGREFDRPCDVASSLQRLVPRQSESRGAEVPVAKFVPFTLKRKVLLKGAFDSQELQRHDLICMCYNASEARILLTGSDGFYSSLLRHVEGLLGPNKVAFLISNYSPVSTVLEPVTADSGLLSPSLKTRLYNQAPLRVYLDSGQVFSWNDMPSEFQARRILELTHLELNPRSVLATAVEQCRIL